MQFSARIKRFSSVYQNWRGTGRLHGQLGKISFKYLPNQEYESDALTPDQVAWANTQPAITLSATAEIPGFVAREMAAAAKAPEPPMQPVVMTPVEPAPLLPFGSKRPAYGHPSHNGPGSKGRRG